MVKVVGIVGSPRIDGNTEFLVKTALNKIGEEEDFEVELITLADKEINYCIGCGVCIKTNKCAFNDDMVEITRKVADCDGLIFASPVYFGDMTGLAKSCIDRLRPLRRVHALKYTVCGAISTGGFRNGGQETTIASIHDFFNIQGGIVVGDNMPTGHYGGTGHADTSSDEVGIITSINLATRMVDVIKKLNNIK